MTAQEWQTIKCRWFQAYQFYFRLDGVAVTLEQMVTKRGAIEYMTYVNGEFRGAWTLQDCPERRFLRPAKRKLYTPKQRRCLKKLSKKALKALNFDPDVAQVYYTPFWRSFAAFKKHVQGFAEAVYLGEYLKNANLGQRG